MIGVVVLLWGAPSRAEVPIERVLVLDLAASGVDATVARNLSEVFALAIRKAKPGVTVVGQADIAAMLALERQRDLVTCEGNVSCLAEIGGALGADHLAVGTVGRIGAVHLVTLKLIDSKRAQPVRGLSEEVPGNEESLVEAVRQLGAHLVDPARPIGIGFIDIGGTGAVTLDDAPLGRAPVARQSVAAGMHTVRWEDGREVAVRVGAYALVQAVPESVAVTLGRPRDRSWFIEASSGISTLLSAPGLDGNPGVAGVLVRGGWISSGSWVLYAMAGYRMFEVQHEPLGPGATTAGLDGPVFGVGAGYLVGSDVVRFIPAIGFDVGTALRDTDDLLFDNLGVSAGTFLLGLTPRLDVRFRPLGWLELGVGLQVPLMLVPKGTVVGAQLCFLGAFPGG